MPEEPQAVDAPDTVVPAQGPAPQAPGAQAPGAQAPGAQAPGAQAPGAQAPGAQAPGAQRPLPVHRTRISGLWVAIGCFCVLLLFALLFILQNGRSVDITYFGAHGHLPLGVALLLAALCGGLLVALVGTARILQLRRQHRKS